MTNSTSKLLTAIIVVALLILGGYYFFTPEERTLGEKIDDAAGELSNGLDDAGKALEDRSPAEKVQDAVKDAAEGN